MRAARIRFAAILLAVLTGSCGGSAWPEPGHGPSAIELTATQRHLADELVSLFEHGEPEPRYGAVESLGDGRGLTCGTIGFTTSSDEVREIVESYDAAVPGSRLARHLPRLRELADAGSDDTGGLPGFAEDWAAAAGDPAFRAEQDRLTDQLAYGPALQDAHRLGLRTPLGVAVLFDSAVQHGTGDDPDGLPALIDRATQRAGGTPAGGVAEPAWLVAFLDVRADTLRNPHDRDTRDAWSESVDRVAALRDLVNRADYGLAAPLTVTLDGDEHELR
ncbi:chitosanase [Dactylosporangium sp. CS-047395]|uniref:chitosanase n=1 Tax=Dactylosporangium sp. CS-047395 TaxID=3239936 RepID=UPI003D8FEB23